MSGFRVEFHVDAACMADLEDRARDVLARFGEDDWIVNIDAEPLAFKFDGGIECWRGRVLAIGRRK